MLILLDNYDSFTYNLKHYLEQLGESVEVVRNDHATPAELLARKPAGIVVSPGPCTPDDAGITCKLIEACAEAAMPMFGVCLGYQALGQVFGGVVKRGDRPMHGKVTDILHEDGGVFRGLPSPFKATRYHSLVVERETLPDCLMETAWAEDGALMGLSHRELPLHGVQFHPESIATEHGHDLLKNFLSIELEKA
ncbi:MAG: aminodeoxychorismate/anthranilate synthase component II [Alphaproteobacteria bacterium]